MKICILTQDLYSLGGVQRTISLITNSMSNDINYSIHIVMPTVTRNKKCFDIDPHVMVTEISLIFDRRFPLLYKPLNVINRRTRLLDNSIGMQISEKLFYKSGELEKLIEWVNKNKFDIVVGATANYALLVGFIAPYISAKSVGWMHSTYDGYYRRRGQNLYGYEKLNRKILSNLDAMIVLNSEDRLKFEEHCKVPSYVLYNPIEKKACAESINKQYDIIFVGRLNTEVKGLDYLLQIIKYLSRTEDLRVVIVGEGDGRKYLKEQIEKKKLDKVVELVGYTPNVSEYYKKSKILVSTSRWEGFGLTIIEAMDFGLPAVAFDNPGPSEIITDTRDGFIIPKYDIEKFAHTIKSLLDNKDLYDTLSRGAKQKAESFYVDRIVERFKFLLDKVKNYEEETNNYN